MKVWIAIESATEIWNGENQTAEIALENGFVVLTKAFASKQACENWIATQEYWWKYAPCALEVEE